MHNPPLKMILQPLITDVPKEVEVYDFMHDTVETFQSLALCWDPKAEMWLTVPITTLKPINTKPSKKILTEAKG